MQQALPHPDTTSSNIQQNMSREAKRMRVMLMLCVKEKSFDAPVMENLFQQYIEAEQMGGSQEDIDAQFKKAVRQTYGPRSNVYFDAISGARTKLIQLEHAKRSKVADGSGQQSQQMMMQQPVQGPSSLNQQQMPTQVYPHQQHQQGMGMPMNPDPNMQNYQHVIMPNNQYNINQRPGQGQSNVLQQQPNAQQQRQVRPNMPPQQQQQNQGMIMPPQSAMIPVQGNLSQLHNPQLSQQHHMHPMSQLPQQQTQSQYIQQQQPHPSQNLYSQQGMNLSSGQMGMIPHANINANSQGLASGINLMVPRGNLIDASKDAPTPASSAQPKDLADEAPEAKKKKATKKKTDDEGGEGKKAKADAKKGKGKVDSAESKGVEVKSELKNPTVIDEIENMTEKANIFAEGYNPTDKLTMITSSLLEQKDLMNESAAAKNLLRDNLDKPGLEVNPILFDSHDSGMERNVVDSSIIDSIIQKSGLKVGFSADAKKLLSEGLQSHLKTVLESAHNLSRKKLNRTTYAHYHESYSHIKQNNGDADEYLVGNVGIKWGPNVKAILQNEEKQLQQFYQDFTKMDEDILVTKMKAYDDEKVGAKKRVISNDNEASHWWDIDQKLEEEGLLSLELLSEVWKKSEIASKNNLGPNINKRKNTRKGDATAGDANANSPNKDQNGNSMEVEDPPVQQLDENWEDQTCPITLPKEIVVSGDDILTVINKSSLRQGSLIGKRSDREKLTKSRFRWRLQASKM